MNDQLLPQDAIRLSRAHGKWVAAKSMRNWARADRLRAYLAGAGCSGKDLEQWHPVFEQPVYRRHRLKLRGVL